MLNSLPVGRRCVHIVAICCGAISLGAPHEAAAQTPISIELHAEPAERQVLPGPLTQVWMFRGVLLSGPADALRDIPGSYLGPIISVRQGDSLSVELTNHLPDETIVHWHGMDVPSAMDGHPRDVIAPGARFQYDFPILNRAGTYWFHPHPDMFTAPQVVKGMAGVLIVSDEEEQALPLPRGEFDVPLVLQDRQIDGENQWIYAPPMMGYLGDHILVNGQSDFVLSAATRVYRLRFVNGSNARIYKLAWDDQSPMIVLGTDGGLLEAPVQKPYVMLAPGERIEVWADFSDRPLHTQLTLTSQSFSGHGQGGFPPLEQGTAFDVMRVSIDREQTENLVLPSRLSTVWRYRAVDAVNADNPRRFAITFDAGRFFLNGRSFEMNGVAADEITTTNTLETWEFDNDTGSLLTMVHPMHAHGRSFQILSREVNPAYQAGWETVHQGHVDEGWKDTVMVMPGERVRTLVRTSRLPGMYLYHCHNLEHEDRGMMRNYRLDQARDVNLAVQSSCPGGGPARVSWTGATPQGQVALLYAPGAGDFIIPIGHPCSGTGLDLAPALLRLVYSGSGGANGARSVTGNANARACEGRLQLLDLDTCSASPAVRLQ